MSKPKGIVDRVAGWFGYQKRAHPSQYNDILRSIFGISESYAGIEVSSKNAMESSAFLCGVSRIADDIAGLPRKVYRKMPDDSRERDVTHWAVKLLSDAPNPWMSAFTWFETTLHHLLVESNSYSRIYRNARGDGAAVVILDPAAVKPKLKAVDGEVLPALWYEVDAGGLKEMVPASDMIHVRALSWNGIEGRSRVRLGKEDIGLSLAIQRYGATFFRRPVPPIALEFPEELTPETFARIAQDWADRYSGLENSHKPAFLEAGAKAHVLGFDPEKSQAIEASKKAVTDIARLLKMPPHLVGDLEHATFSNIEHQQLQYAGGTLVPLTNRIKAELDIKLFSEEEREAGYYMEFDYAGLLRGDLLTRYTAYKMAREGGWMSVNDVRRRENENPVEGGDQYMQPLNMAPLGQEGGAEDEEGQRKLRLAS